MDETFKERKERGLRAASVEVNPVHHDIEFMLAAANRERRPETAPLPGESEGLTEGGSVTQIKGGLKDTVTMYKPTPNGWMPRRVPIGSIAMNLAQGWRTTCGDCGGLHGADPNECPDRAATALRLCPVCGKRIYDNRVTTGVDPHLSDANVIQDDAYRASTPASRTKAALDWHIWNRHPQEAREMGLAALPEAPRLSVPEALQGPAMPPKGTAD